MVKKNIIKIIIIFYFIFTYSYNISAVLTNMTITPDYDGYISLSLGIHQRIDNSTVMNNLGAVTTFPSSYRRGFLNFNTNGMGINISKIYLKVNVSQLGGSWDSSSELKIIRLNNTKVNNTFPNSSNLFDQIGYSNPYTIRSGITSTGLQLINLSSTAISDILNQSTSKYFSLGIRTNEDDDELIDISTMESSYKPQLIIQYDDTCSPPASGDWTINITCNIANSNYNVPANLIIQSAGYLTLNNSILNFSAGSNQRIKIYTGGRIKLGTTSRIK